MSYVPGSEGAPWAAQAEAASRQYVKHCRCSGARFVRLPYPQGHPLFGKDIPCICKLDDIARDRARRLWRMSGISPERLKSSTFDAYDPDKCPESCREYVAGIKALCEKWAEHPKGWLGIIGSVGTGKTHLATAIARHQLDRTRSVYMATMADMLDMLREGYGDQTVGYDERLRLLREVEVLILDDLGAERRTDWTQEAVYQVINDRYERRRPMVVTSNVELEAAAEHVDDRIISRLRHGSEHAGGFVRVIRMPQNLGDMRPRMGA